MRVICCLFAFALVCLFALAPAQAAPGGGCAGRGAANTNKNSEHGPVYLAQGTGARHARVFGHGSGVGFCFQFAQRRQLLTILFRR